MDRKWLSDVIYTVDRVRFDKMIKDAYKDQRKPVKANDKAADKNRPTPSK
jgi:hypothetical protein